MSSSYLSRSFIVPAVLLVAAFIILERRGIKLKELMPVVVMTAAAVFGRVIFTFIPQVQPVTAIVIIMGLCCGVQGGFLTGVLTAFVSNIFMGMGPWTVWQMCAWGIVGILSGVLGKSPLCRKWWFLLPYSAVTAFLYSIIVDIWTVSTLGTAVTAAMVLTTFASGLIFNISHAVGNVIFVLLLYKPIDRRFERIRRKYEILCR